MWTINRTDEIVETRKAKDFMEELKTMLPSDRLERAQMEAEKEIFQRRLPERETRLRNKMGSKS